ncbi:nitroreductase family protein [Microbaculum marinisediminis]|uniref:Putative NAD(P)H nitroreductase n=1 Tax=Microbaculum marinisediminis TaxID=2931392 RepID=A0AAW5QYM0_9HYPH|nr:nitroreductase [Microbaculum sp. A6E488]MCT8973151.1 nitroreductase [Microbaculum sp. A6E488]
MNKPNTDLMTYLSTRRSIPSAKLVEPAPSKPELDRILTIAARVPDHGKLAPWRFVVIAGEARSVFVDRLMAIWRANHPDASAEAEAVERGKKEGGPLVVAVISRTSEHPKVPAWEQELSAGAACMNLLHAAHASGYAGQWLTGWPAFDADVATLLAVEANERIAGFVYIGTPAEPPSERDRPDLSKIVTEWRG